MKPILISLPEEEFWLKMEKLLDSRINKILAENKPKSMNSYSINQVAKKLQRGHATIKGLVSAGILKTTRDSRIMESELERYLEESR